MSVINTRDGACLSYYSLNLWFENRSGSILFLLPDKILDSVMYFGLYKLTFGMRTDSVMIAMALHRCGEIDWSRTAVRDGFAAYNFESGAVIGL